MLRLTLAQMRRSLGRLTAAAIAIAIGTGFVAATLLTGGVIQRASYDSVTARFAQADLVVDGDVTGLLDQIRAVPGVEAVDPVIIGGLEVRKGASRSWQLMLPVASDPSLSSLTIADGRAPQGADEIALPRGVAERLDVEVGGTVEVSWTEWPDDADPVYRTRDVTVTGLTADPGGAWTGFGGATLAVQDSVLTWTNLSPDLVGSEGALVKAPRDTATVDEALRTMLDAATADRSDLAPVTVQTRDEAAEDQIEETGGGENFVVGSILAFAAVSLIVAGLVISNTFQVLVAQRARTLALLRCVGAVRGQLRRSVLLEAAILGVGASVVGVLLGTGVAQGALSVLGRMQDDMPLPAYVTVTPSVLLVPMLVGVVVTVLAALVPARAATQVSPIAALRPLDAPDVASRAGKLRLGFALVLFVGGTGVLTMALVGAHARAGDALTWLGVGILGGFASFVGVLVGAVFWVPFMVALVGRLLGRTGPAARLAAANTVRNPRRTAATSTALLIGVTLVALMSTGAASARASLAAELDSHYLVDIEITSASGGIDPLPADVERTVADVVGVERAVDVRSAEISIGDDWYTARSLTPEVEAVLRDDRIAAAADDDTIVVTSSVVDPSQPVTLRDPYTGEPVDEERSRVLEPVVVGSGRGGAAYLTPSTFGAIVGTDVPTTTVWARIASDADAVAVVEAVRNALSDESVVIESPVSSRMQYEQLIDTLLAIVVGLLAVAVVIALVGVANTLSLSVIERRRESATLRAIGLTKRRLRLSLAAEGMLISGVGGVLGVVLGVLYGWAGSAITFSTMGDARLAVPWTDVALIMAVAVGAGLLASVLPARSAVRTSPVAALAVD